MSPCWTEGELRAYADGELPPLEMEELAAHLGECAACRKAREQMAQRAAWLAGLLAELPEPAVTPPCVPPLRRKTGYGRWVAVGLAAAAVLAALFVRLPAPRQAPGPAPAISVVQPQAPPEPPPASAPAPAVRTVPRRAASAPKVDAYVVLDDQPLDAGYIVRMDIGPRHLPADVIFGADGHARAIRLISDR